MPTIPTLNSLVGSAANAISSGNYAGGATALVTGGVGSIAISVGALANSSVSGALTSLTGGAANVVGSITGGAANAVGALTGSTANLISGGASALLGKLPALPTMPALPTAQGVAGAAFKAVTDGFGKFTAGIPQNLKKIAEDKAAAVAKAGVGSLGNITGAATGIGGALSGAVGSVTGAVTSVTGAANGIGGALSGAVGSVTSATSSLSSSIASGVNGLPGGQQVISAVVNNAAGALNKIPGASDITAALGKIGGATDLLAKVKAGGTTLSALAATGLTPAAAAQMTAALGKLSSVAGAIPISLPIVAENTTNRGAITAGLTLLLSKTSKLVPVPNLSGNPATFGKVPSDEEAKKYNEKKALIEKTMDEYWALKNTCPAYRAYEKAKNDLPQGDPQLDSLRAAWVAEDAAIAALLKKVDNLRAS